MNDIETDYNAHTVKVKIDGTVTDIEKIKSELGDAGFTVKKSALTDSD